MFRIGEFSLLGKTTIKALRYYDEVDLLKPAKIDQSTGYRFYSSEQLVRLHRIQSYRQIGLTIDEIKFILSGQDATSILLQRRTELISELAQKTTQLSRIEFILHSKEKESLMSYDYTATIKEQPECIVYSKKMTIPNYDAYFQLIPAIGRQIVEKYPDLKCATPEYCINIYLDGEYRDQDISVEFCEAVDRMWPDFDDIHFKTIDAATVVSVMHKGPYSEISQAYAFAFMWIDENGYTAADNPRENYIDGIWNKDSEADWLTELQIPVVKG